MQEIIKSANTDLMREAYNVGIDFFEKSKKEAFFCNVERQYRNPSFSIFASMVYGFSKNLPYSIDIEQEEYVPADFFNAMPLDVDTNPWFKWDDRRTFFNAMYCWGDTRKTGMLLQICYLLQKLILGEIVLPENAELSDEDFINLGINKITNDEKYNKAFFSVFRNIPLYYHQIVDAPNKDARRKALEDIYHHIFIAISARFAGCTPIRPDSDFDLLTYNENMVTWDGIPEITKMMKDEQLARYNSQKKNTLQGDKRLAKFIDNQK